MANIKISQLPAKGANLASTDLVEISEFNGSGYVSKSITGQEIIDAVGGGLPAWVETNATDLTLWNNGKGNIATNTSFGDGALKSNTSGSNNTIIGRNASDASTTAQGTVAIGMDAFGQGTTGSFNISVGYGAANNLTTGSNNVIIGAFAVAASSTVGDCIIIGGAAGADSKGIAIGATAYASQSGIAIGQEAFATVNGIAIGSEFFPAGTVASQVNTSTKYWEVVINGVTQKILLA